LKIRDQQVCGRFYERHLRSKDRGFPSTGCCPKIFERSLKGFFGNKSYTALKAGFAGKQTGQKNFRLSENILGQQPLEPESEPVIWLDNIAGEL
jgi:hypothetical protein